MLRRSPRIKIASIANRGHRNSDFFCNVDRPNLRYNHEHEPPFYSSAPQSQGQFSRFEDLQEEEEEEEENHERITQSTTSRRDSSDVLNINNEISNYKLPSVSDRKNFIKKLRESIPQIRNINATNVQNDNSSLINDIDDINDTAVDVPTNSLLHQDEEQQQQQTRIYKRRFWILFVFCTLNWFSCIEWNTWGPIIDSVSEAFPNWTSFTVAMMENWVSFVFLICVLPVCWLTGKVGLRLGVLMSSFLLALGLSLRCITNKSSIFTIMCHACSILIGMSMTLILSAPPMVASVWFPPSERTTAASIIFAVGQLGTVGSYLEPLVIRDPSSGASPEDIKGDIMTFMYIVAGFGVFLFIIIFIYFPSSPPLPPSYTSSTNRINFKEGLKSVFRNSSFIIFVIMYGIAIGPSLGWMGVLNYSLKPMGFNQNEAMFIGLVASFSCCFLTVVTGRLTDMVYGYLKETIIGLLLASSISYYWFLLLFEGVIPFSRWQVFVSVSLGLSFNYAAIPLFYELSVEIVYPVHEVLVGGLVTASDSLSTCIFLFLYSFKDIGFGWVNYVLVVSNALPVLILLFVSLKYGRAKLDIEESGLTEE